MKKKIKNAVSAFLLLSLIVCLLPATVIYAEKKTVSRDIAIVFDNSGSMYTSSGNKITTWCEATYAMEVFASMINDGDQLSIYPMNAITVNGQKKTYTEPLVLGNAAEATTIEQIMTPEMDGEVKNTYTPVESVDAAYEAIKGSTKNEKWLIVLTDGASFYKENQELDTSTTKQMLSEKFESYVQTTDRVNIVYLGIDVDSNLVPTVGDQTINKTFNAAYYGETASSTGTGSNALRPKLSAICNTIFGRDELTGKYKSASNVNFDIPLSKLIVFDQGSNASSDAIIPNLQGNKAPVSYSKAETRGAQNTNLNGVIATYTDVDAGSYDLDCSGDVVVYYEPNVSLQVQLIDEDGFPAKGDTCYPGEYTADFRLVDANGKETTSELLGDINYTCNYKFENGDSGELKNGDKITLGENAVLQDINVTASFLSNYTLKASMEDFGLSPNGLTVIPKEHDFIVTVSGGKDEYYAATMEDEGVYLISAAYDGVPMTAEQYANTEVKYILDGIDCVGETSDKGIAVSLKHKGLPTETEEGFYTLDFDITFHNEDGKNIPAKAHTVEFTVVQQSFKAVLIAKDSYFNINDIESCAPLQLNLKLDGEPLTDEQLCTVEAVIDAEGLQFDQKILPGEYAIELRLKPGDYETGSHRVNVKGFSNIYGETNEDSVSINIQTVPLWIKWLIAGIILLLLALLIWFILTRKILPKRIEPDTATERFISEGELFKKKGTWGESIGFFDRIFTHSKSVNIESPKAGSRMYLASTIEIKAVSTIKDCIFNKKSLKVDATLKGASQKTNAVILSNTKFSRNEEKKIFTDTRGNAECNSVIHSGDKVKLDGENLTYTTGIIMKW